jgi:dolichol kinase
MGAGLAGVARRARAAGAGGGRDASRLALVPTLARAVPLAARLERTVAGGDERWSGLVHYAIAATALTAIAVAGHGFAAAAGLWALALGDGPGGAVGRRLGRHRFRAPGAKPKSLEGTAAVALGAALGALAAGAWFAHPIAPAIALAIGAVAALAEAVAPRGTDNLTVPAAAWLAAELLA